MPYKDPAKQAESRRVASANATPQLRARWTERKRLRRLQRRREILYAEKAKPCADCGQSFPTVCMDFDHRPGESKLFALGGATDRYALALVLAEIAKCDVVCANCHRIRTEDRRVAALC